MMSEMVADLQGCMRLLVFWSPKRGNADFEYEDAFASDLNLNHFALADGATESSFSKQWAKLLVDSFVQQLPTITLLEEADFRAWLTPIQQTWYRLVPWDKLYGMKKVKASQGTCSSFLGLWFTQEEASFRWHSIAIGDACLFWVRSNQLLTSFPMKQADEFSSAPNLLCSDPATLITSISGRVMTTGICNENDLFILATDSISEWFLREVEAGNSPWETIIALKEQNDFNAWAEQLLDNGQMRNDDMTVMIICPGKGDCSMEGLKLEGIRS